MALISVAGMVAAHDPTIVKHHGIYYRFQTGEGLPFFKSRDLKNWEIAGAIFPRNPQWTKEQVPGSTSFWAPEVVYRDGWWRIYYSVSTFGKNLSSIGLVRTKSLDPESPDYGWQDLGPVISSKPENNYNCIDPAVFCDDKGKDRLVFGSFWGGVQMVDLDCDGFVADGSKPRTIASRTSKENPIEGAFVFPHQGKYYLFASHDFCCRGTASSYHIVYGVSENPEGPFYDEEDRDMMKDGGTTLRDGFSFSQWAGPGHNSIFRDDDGKIYMVYHGYDRTEEGKHKLLIEEIKIQDGIVSL